ncbi:MAG: ATP-dependent metallopeptidase FtsH/Yme1/Tma family protein, partial [Paracoccus sp. (in: a-proteobacteria)]|nr:ATP-dependent metallopeptidase FtsH/Yme1/Tma family protein [Paracoccus sp. (in: a-proteobacteria)]
MGNTRNIAFWVVLFLMILMLFNLFSDGASQASNGQLSYSEFVERVEKKEVSSAVINGEEVQFRTTDGKQFTTIRPQGEEIASLMISNGVDVSVRKQQQSGFMSFLGVWLPFILLIGVWIFFMNRMQGGGKGGAMGFGKSRAKLLTEKHGRVTFDDVAGIDEAKEELEEIVEFLRNPQKFSRLGGKIPKGALLV